MIKNNGNSLKSLYLLILILYITKLCSIPPINLFRPTDRPLLPDIFPGTKFQFMVGFEHAIKVKGFKEVSNQMAVTKNEKEHHEEVNVLQIYEKYQEIGDKYKCIPHGTFKTPISILASARYVFDNNINIGLYLPYYEFELQDTTWKCNKKNKLLDKFTKKYDINIGNWKRAGIGDLVLEAIWMKNYMQNKPLITNVRPQLRLGLDFPTSKRQNYDKILAIPFGNDGSWGIQFAAGIDLNFRWFLRGGIDAEFLYLFGSRGIRRIQTQLNQTDLLLSTKVDTFKDFGLGQQYNLYLQTATWAGSSIKINYQYLKSNEDYIFPNSDKYNPLIVNNAEYLQDWTAHSLIAFVDFDYARINPDASVKPVLLGWFKWGFNGKRAILINSIGATLTISF